MSSGKKRRLSATSSSAKKSALALVFLCALLPILGAENDRPSLFPVTRSPQLFVDVGVSVVYPLGRFADIAKTTSGMTAALWVPLEGVERLEAGVVFHYFAFDSEEPEVEGGWTAPMLAEVAYIIMDDAWFTLRGIGGFGAAYNRVSYDEDGIDIFQPGPRFDEKSALNAAASVGLDYRFHAGRLLVLSIGWDYLLIFEDAGPIGAFRAPFTAGVGF